MQLSSLTGGGREPANSTTEGSNNLPFSTLFFSPHFITVLVSIVCCLILFYMERVVAFITEKKKIQLYDIFAVTHSPSRDVCRSYSVNFSGLLNLSVK